MYFASGANREKKMMEWITGNPNLKGTPAVLEGYGLYVQRLEQVPDTVSPGSPINLSPREILKRAGWNEGFTTYMIKPRVGGRVTGTLWELSREERELVRDWEMVELGWYKDLRVKVKTLDGREVEVETEGWREGQEVDHEVNDENHPSYLNNPEDFRRIAKKSRKEYLERTVPARKEFSLRTKE